MMTDRLTSIAEPTRRCPAIQKNVRTDQTQDLCRAQHGCDQEADCPLRHQFQSYDLGVLSDARFKRQGL